MKRKIQIFLLLSVNTTFVIGQSINLLNQTGNQIDSKTVYIGIENRFQVNEYESIAGIESMNYVTLVKDNLIIRPTTPGKLPVTFTTKIGEAETIYFQVREIPNPIIIIGENKMTSIAKSSLINNRGLSIKSADITNSFFAVYTIEYFEAQLNRENFNIHGNQISEQLLKALDKSKSSDKLTLSLVKLYSKKTGAHIKMNGGFTFIIE